MNREYGIEDNEELVEHDLNERESLQQEGREKEGSD